MLRGHKKERSFIILGAIQPARKTYTLVLRVYCLIYGEKKKILRLMADERERFLRRCELICQSGFPCSLAMLMTLFGNIWAVCSCVAKHNTEEWEGECHSLQKTHLTDHSLKCRLVERNVRQYSLDCLAKPSELCGSPMQGFCCCQSITLHV